MEQEEGWLDKLFSFGGFTLVGGVIGAFTLGNIGNEIAGPGGAAIAAVVGFVIGAVVGSLTWWLIIIFCIICMCGSVLFLVFVFAFAIASG